MKEDLTLCSRFVLVGKIAIATVEVLDYRKLVVGDFLLDFENDICPFETLAPSHQSHTATQHSLEFVSSSTTRISDLFRTLP